MNRVFSIVLFVFSLTAGLSAQQQFDIIKQEVCWTTPGAVDSSLVRYVYVSSRGTTATLIYKNSDGLDVDVSAGGTYEMGFCGCCEGVNYGRILYVSGVQGNNATAIVGDPVRCFQTISAAIDSAQSGDMIYLFKGVHNLSGDTLNAKGNIYLYGPDANLQNLLIASSGRAIVKVKDILSIIQIAGYGDVSIEAETINTNGFSDILLGDGHISITCDTWNASANGLVSYIGDRTNLGTSPSLKVNCSKYYNFGGDSPWLLSARKHTVIFDIGTYYRTLGSSKILGNYQAPTDSSYFRVSIDRIIDAPGISPGGLIYYEINNSRPNNGSVIDFNVGYYSGQASLFDFNNEGNQDNTVFNIHFGLYEYTGANSLLCISNSGNRAKLNLSGRYITAGDIYSFSQPYQFNTYWKNADITTTANSPLFDFAGMATYGQIRMKDTKINLPAGYTNPVFSSTTAVNVWAEDVRIEGDFQNDPDVTINYVYEIGLPDTLYQDGTNLIHTDHNGDADTVSISAISATQDTSAFRAAGGVTKQNDPTGYAYRTGNTAVGVDANTHKFRVDGTFQFNPTATLTFDYQDGTTDYLQQEGLNYRGPGGIGTTGPLLAITQDDNSPRDREILGELWFGGQDTSAAGNPAYLSAGIESVAAGNWTGSAKGAVLDFYATSPAENFPRNIMTIEGGGRIELDRYDSFDDNIPVALLGFDANAANDINRHPIAGTVGANSVIGVTGSGAGDSLTWRTVPVFLSASATLDFASTSAQSSSDLTITVTGAALSDVVSLGVPNGSVNANSSFSAWVSAADTVTVRFNNYSAGAIDPASGTFRVSVQQF